MRKKPAGSTLLLVTASRLSRADDDGVWHPCGSIARPPGISVASAVEAALSLGGKPARETWVLTDDLWGQKVTLSPAQVAGLTREELTRALSFEIEPFSGIPVHEAALGFVQGGAGIFTVVEGTRGDFDSIAKAVANAGGRLAGLAHAGTAPEDDETLAVWWPEGFARLSRGEAPLIRPPAPAPSPHRIFHGGLALAVVALAVLAIIAFSQNRRRERLEARNAEFTAVSRELDAANKRATTLEAGLAGVRESQALQANLVRRRSAVKMVMEELAAKRSDAMVVNSIQAEGPSSMIVTGLSLDAEGVDELGIVLTQSLREAGWMVQSRHKTGRQNLPNGGPWDFSLSVTHEEAARSAAESRTGGDYDQ